MGQLLKLQICIMCQEVQIVKTSEMVNGVLKEVI